MFFKKQVDRMKKLPNRSQLAIYFLVVLPVYYLLILTALALDELLAKNAGFILAVLACVYFGAFFLATEFESFYLLLWPPGRPHYDPLMITALILHQMAVDTLRLFIRHRWRRRQR